MKNLKYVVLIVPFILYFAAACKSNVEVTTPSPTEVLDKTNEEVVPESTSTGEASAKPVTEPESPASYKFHLNIVGNGKVTTTSDRMLGDYLANAVVDLPAGSSFVLSAQADSGWKFLGWSGECGGPDCNITMKGETTVNANFVPDVPSPPVMWNLDVRIKESACPYGNRVFSDPVGIDCPGDCEGQFLKEASVKLIAEPHPFCKVSYWQESDSAVTGGDSYNLVMLSDVMQADVSFQEQEYKLKIMVYGSGDVKIPSLSPPAICTDFPCVYGILASKMPVSLIAVPDAGGSFLGWENAGCPSLDTTVPCNLTLHNDTTVVARFKLLPP